MNKLLFAGGFCAVLWVPPIAVAMVFGRTWVTLTLTVMLYIAYAVAIAAQSRQGRRERLAIAKARHPSTVSTDVPDTIAEIEWSQK